MRSFLTIKTINCMKFLMMQLLSLKTFTGKEKELVKIIIHLHKKTMRTGIIIIFILLLLYSCSDKEKQETAVPKNKFVSSGIIDPVPANNIIDSLQKKVLSGAVCEDSILLELAMNYSLSDTSRLKKITKYIIGRKSKGFNKTIIIGRNIFMSKLNCLRIFFTAACKQYY